MQIVNTLKVTIISLDGENIMLSMNISGKKYENEKEHEINLK